MITIGYEIFIAPAGRENEPKTKPNEPNSKPIPHQFLARYGYFHQKGQSLVVFKIGVGQVQTQYFCDESLRKMWDLSPFL
jgi:hypothetical protein